MGRQGLYMCYDCLCLMALFRAVMSLVVMTDRNDTNRLQRCALCARDFAGGPFRGKDSDHGDWSDQLWGRSCGLL